MTLVSGLQGGINLMLISYVPKRFQPYGTVSTVTGLLDAFAYAGSAISTYVVAVIAERLGWGFTVGTWAVIAVLGTLACLAAVKPWRRFFEK